MFRNIDEYILSSKNERQLHLHLEESCIELGTNSQQCRALLAHYLNTTVPKGMKIHLCHACHNGKCSNPRHLYWGTCKENQLDCDFQAKGVKATKGKNWKHSQETKERMSLAKLGKPSNNRLGVNQFMLLSSSGIGARLAHDTGSNPVGSTSYIINTP